MIEMFLSLVVLALVLPLCQVRDRQDSHPAVKIVQSSPSSVSSTNLLDCIAVLLLVGGVVCLGGGAYQGYQTGTWGQGVLFGLAGLVGAACCFLLAGLALNPESLNVQIVPPPRRRRGAGNPVVPLEDDPPLRPHPAGGGDPQLAGGTGLGGLRSLQGQVGPHSGQCRHWGLPGCDPVHRDVRRVYLLFLLYHLMVDLMPALFEIAANTRPHEHVEADGGGREAEVPQDAESGRP